MSVKFKFESLEQPFEADWPVRVMTPQDGGGFVEETFMARFRYLEADELKASSEANEDGPTFMARYFVGLGKGEGELTEALRQRMWARAYVREAVALAWQEFQRGALPKN